MNNLRTIRRSGTTAALLIAMAGLPSMAHHSVAVFDQSKTIVFHGTAAKWLWANPHTWLYVRVNKNDGTQEVWGFEAGGTSMLINSGWNSADIKAGDEITVTAAPERDNQHIGLLEKVHLPDGRVLSSGFGAPSGPPDRRAQARRVLLLAQAMPTHNNNRRNRFVNTCKMLLAATLYLAMQGGLPAVAGTPLGSSWADAAKLPDFFTGDWQSASPMLDAPVDAPYTDKAKAYVDHYKPIKDLPYAGATCKTPGMPLIQRVGSPLKFFYQPGMIAVYIENDSMTRFIKLNAQHSARPNPTYLGESVGHFDGDTLVVDSVGFVNDIELQYGDLPGGSPAGPLFDISKAIFGPHGPHLRMSERFRLLDPDTMEDQLTIYDDTIWKKPYVAGPVQIFRRNRGDAGWPQEWVCSNADILNFDPAQNKTIEQDPAQVLKELESKGTN